MKLNRYQIFAGIVLIVISAALKAITFPYSITPIIAISFFSGVSFKNRQWAFSMPLFAMFFSDCLMEIFRDGQGFYGSGFSGWMNCLIAGIPFLEKGILTDLSYVAILFTANHFLASYFVRKDAIAK